MKAASEKTSDTSSKTVIQTKGQPLFNKEGGGSFFGPNSMNVPFIQSKLQINEPGDKYEQEADQMADQVVQRLAMPPQKNTPLGISSLSATIQPSKIIQTKCDSCEYEEKIQRKEDEGLEDQVEIQRKEEGGVPEFLSYENETNKITAVNSQSTGVHTKLKNQIESLSGIDLGNLKIHYNSSKPEYLNALAYAQGEDIYLGPGQEKHLTHEAWHIVQQKQGRVHPTIQIKGVQINNSPELEQEADMISQKLEEKGIVALKKDESPIHYDKVIQRFEAPGHEAVGRKALTEGGKFSNDEASMIYFGNWMRDMNQVFVPAFSDSIGKDATYALIQTLAVQKFGRVLTPDLFGYYIPSEHIDNPGGQIPGLDYFISPPEIDSESNKTGKDRFGTQHFQTRTREYQTPQESTATNATILGANIFAVDQSGVMAYIRRTNLHVERRLTLSAIKGRTPEGMVHFGAALHAVEDLFAHSNFIEIALNQILKDHPAETKDGKKGLLPDLTGENRRVQTLASQTEFGRPTLITGTFTGLDTLESIGSEGVKMLRKGLGKAQTEQEKLAQQALISALLKKFGYLNKDPIVQKKLKEENLGFIENVDVSYIYDKLREIPKLNLGLLDWLTDWFTDLANKEFLNPAADVVEKQLLVTKVQDTALYKTKKEAQEVVDSKGKKVSTMKQLAAAITKEPVDIKKNLEEARARLKVLESTPTKILANPSHSQLSKDHSNSIFFGLAFQLAVEADKLLRDKMLVVWGSSQVEDPYTKEVYAKKLKENQEAENRKKKSSWEVFKDTIDPNSWFPTAPKDEILMAEVRLKAEEESLKTGKSIFFEGKKAGQEYNLQKIRDDSANRITAIAKNIRNLVNIPTNTTKSIESVKKLMKDNSVKNNTTYELLDKSSKMTESVDETEKQSSTVIRLLENADSFDKIAKSVRNADTLIKREVVFEDIKRARGELLQSVKKLANFSDWAVFGSLLVLIDQELAIVAPAFTSEQIKMLNDTSPENALKHDSFKNLSDFSNIDKLLVSDAKKIGIKNILLESQKIINHPESSNWWKPSVMKFINQHSLQITEEIKARNAGYANFGNEKNQ